MGFRNNFNTGIFSTKNLTKYASKKCEFFFVFFIIGHFPESGAPEQCAPTSFGGLGLPEVAAIRSKRVFGPSGRFARTNVDRQPRTNDHGHSTTKTTYYIVLPGSGVHRPLEFNNSL